MRLSKNEETTVVPPAAVEENHQPDSLPLQESLARKVEEMATKKKQDEKNLKLLRELTALACNKHCFDCQQRGPTYVNMTIGSFVCTTCSGLLRGLTPPHRVKSISMASFTDDEITLLKSRGNEYCRRVWLGLYDASQAGDKSDENYIKDFMVNKYERKRFYLEPSKVSLPKPSPSPQLPLPQQSSTPLARPSVALPRTTPTLSSPNLNNNLSGLGNRVKKDPFSPLAPGPAPQQDNFANFDNAPIFNAASASPANFTPFKQHHQQQLQNLSNTISTPPMAIVSNGTQSEDRYAALKDLDTLMKGATISTSPFPTSSSVFDSPSSQIQSSTATPMFLSPDSVVSSPGNPFAVASSPPNNNSTNPWGTSPSFPSQPVRPTNPFENIFSSSPAATFSNGSSENGWSANFQDAFNNGSPFTTQENNNKGWGLVNSNNSFNNPFEFGAGATTKSSNPFL